MSAQPKTKIRLFIQQVCDNLKEFYLALASCYYSASSTPEEYDNLASCWHNWMSDIDSKFKELLNSSRK